MQLTDASSEQGRIPKPVGVKAGTYASEIAASQSLTSSNQSPNKKQKMGTSTSSNSIVTIEDSQGSELPGQADTQQFDSPNLHL